MSQIPIALQLYTLRDDISADLVKTLKKVSELGYQNVELAGFADQSAKDFKQLLSDFGLQAISAHIGIDALQGEGVAKVLDDYNELGCSSIVVPWLGEEWRNGTQGYIHTAEVLDEIGARLHTEGFQLGYHNHNFEFEDKFDGKTGIELLIENSSPSLLQFELDTYWALYAGVDPVKFIESHGDRITLLHIKDMDAQDRSFAPVGTGILPLDGIVSAAVKAGVKYLVVEQDSATKETPLESVEISITNLKAKGYL